MWLFQNIKDYTKNCLDLLENIVISTMKSNKNNNTYIFRGDFSYKNSLLEK